MAPAILAVGDPVVQYSIVPAAPLTVETPTTEEVAMSSWIVPPIVVPVFIAVFILAYALYRTYP
jgi:ABC-type transport system involved in cytochrome c biogenesis permease component